jgi:TolB protein
MLGVATWLAGSWPARAELRIDITRGVVQPMPIAIAPFEGGGAEGAKLGKDLSEVIAADLERSGLFRPLDPRTFPQTMASIDATPAFGEWQGLGAPALVNGRISRAEDGRLKVEFRLWDVFAQQQLAGMAYSAAADNWRRMAHIVADAIYKRLTGEEGYFDTRIVYIAESGPTTRRVKRLAMMDQDGANHRYLSDGSELVLTPRFSPTRQQITFSAFTEGVPRVYILDLDSGRRTLVGDFPGMTFAPRFSPDGQKLVLSMAKDGNTDIYEVDLNSRSSRRLTSNAAIDTSPSYSPDGRSIVFNSDRGGSQQLYVMNEDGSNVRRISQGSGKYATPVWSPRGDFIAFTKIVGGKFHIGVMSPEGGGERLLSSGYLVEGPTWAPNGRVLLFYESNPVDSEGRGGWSRLRTVDASGGNEREIPTPGDASDPAWSPLLGG